MEHRSLLSRILETAALLALSAFLIRLAACFLDSIATLGLNGDGIGLNYHMGLFKQVFEDHLQRAEKNQWIESNSWLKKEGSTFEVAFGDSET